MRERPILFSAPMIRAILEGRKTQTRRVIKPQPDFAEQPSWSYGEGYAGKGWYCYETEYPDEGSQFYSCPYGDFGTQLWVRETWAEGTDREANHSGILFRADYEPGYPDVPWRPSIHMPRWASRITLAITEVRVQRVQEISREDAISEGIDCDGGDDEHRNRSTLENFRLLWDSINANRGFGWDANPWVWALTFKVLDAALAAGRKG